MKALINVGGLGKPMRPLTLSVPKPLVDFANKPIILHQIEALKEVGVTEVVITIYYLPEELVIFSREIESELGIKITCLRGTKPLTCPLALARDKLLCGSNEPFFVLNVNVISEYPLSELISFHKSHGGEATVMVTEVQKRYKPSFFERYKPSFFDFVVMQEETGKVERYAEKPNTSVGSKINAGIYLLSPSVLERIGSRATSVDSFEKELLPSIAADQKLFAMVLPGFWMDVGYPIGYFLGVRRYLKSLQKKSSPKLATGPRIVGNVLVHETAVVGEECLIGPNVVIGPDCVVESGVRLSRCTLMRGAHIKKNSYISGSIIGWRSTVGQWARLENVTILGEDVHVSDRISCNGVVAHPHTTIKSDIPNPRTVM